MITTIQNPNQKEINTGQTGDCLRLRKALNDVGQISFIVLKLCLNDLLGLNYVLVHTGKKTQKQVKGLS